MTSLLCLPYRAPHFELEASTGLILTVLFLGMAFQRRHSASLKRNGDTSGKFSSLHTQYTLLLILIAVLPLVALFTAMASTARVSGSSVDRGGVPAAGPGGRSELPLPARPRRASIANESDFLAFVASEPDAEYEKQLIKQVLEGIRLDPQWRQQARTASEPSRLPSPHDGPLWPQFQALLRAWAAMKRFDPIVMQSLVAAIKEPIDRHRQVRHHAPRPAAAATDPTPSLHQHSLDPQQQQQQRRYASCAVVGNSGILLNSTYGEAIDAHEAVVRLNNARAKGFEKHVGRKTTIAFMTSNIFHKCARRVRCHCRAYYGSGRDEDDDPAIVMYVSQVEHLMDVAICRTAHGAPLLVTDPRFDALTARIAKWYSLREFGEHTGKPLTEWPWGPLYTGVQGFHYSSGMQAVILALGICEEVDLYGFGKANGTKHHYHTAQAKELDIHDYAAEYIFYDELVSPASREAIPFLQEAGIRLARVRVFGLNQRDMLAKS